MSSTPSGGVPFEYEGTELDLFSAASVWKDYLRAQMERYVAGQVLEVGAGIGGTTAVLLNQAVRRWVCLEPDPKLAARLRETVREGALPEICEVVDGTLENYAEGGFDCLLYVDVLEHIEDDRGEVARAATRLRPGGHLVALSPAHPWLFSPFDDAVGHHRRYTRATMAALAPPAQLRPVRLAYLDSVGLLASAGNRFLLSSSHPTARQIRFWDRVLVRASRAVDPLLAHRVGKSVLAVWRRTGEEEG